MNWLNYAYSHPQTILYWMIGFVVLAFALVLLDYFLMKRKQKIQFSNFMYNSMILEAMGPNTQNMDLKRKGIPLSTLLSLPKIQLTITQAKEMQNTHYIYLDLIKNKWVIKKELC